MTVFWTNNSSISLTSHSVITAVGVISIKFFKHSSLVRFCNLKVSFCIYCEVWWFPFDLGVCDQFWGRHLCFYGPFWFISYEVTCVFLLCDCLQPGPDKESREQDIRHLQQPEVVAATLMLPDHEEEEVSQTDLLVLLVCLC